MVTDPLMYVDRLYGELSGRLGDIQKHEAYYEGDHPLKFATPEFSKAFGGLFNEFSDNWCAVVVDAKSERLEVSGFRAKGGRENDAATWDLWRAHGLDADSNAAITDALTCSRAFGLAWPGPDGPELTFEHASEAIVGYEPGSRRRVAALKTWCDDTTEFATLYDDTYAYKFERARRETASGLQLGNAKGWLRREVPAEPWPLAHDLGAVPMVELPNRLRLNKPPRSELHSVIPVQNAVNLLWAHLITASDFAAFNQRVVLGTERPMEAVYDGDGNITGQRPIEIERFRASRMMFFGNPDAKIAEWGATDLSNYTKVIELAVRHIAAQTKTPPDYLLGQMANLSGEALTAAERGLVKAVHERQNALKGGLREFMRLAHLANDDTASAQAIADGTIVWRDAQYRTEGEHVDALMKMKALGVPDEAIWERIPGVDQTEIDRWKSMQTDSVARALGGDLAAALTGPKEPAAPVEV